MDECPFLTTSEQKVKCFKECAFSTEKNNNDKCPFKKIKFSYNNLRGICNDYFIEEEESQTYYTKLKIANFL